MVYLKLDGSTVGKYSREEAEDLRDQKIRLGVDSSRLSIDADPDNGNTTRSVLATKL